MSQAMKAHPDLVATVGGRFRPGRILGNEGAFVVQLAADTSLRQKAALKRPKDPANPRSMASLAVEAAALSRLKHPGIPSLISFALEGDEPYLAMEYVSGIRYNLNNILDDREACVVRLTISACQALAEAHGQGIIHRDICPANLVMSHDRKMLSVLDFGVAYVPGQSDLGADRHVGRPDFMAPEQTAPGTKIDGRADVFSLGVIAYMYLSGSTPYALGPSNDEGIMHAHRTMDPVPLSRAAPGIEPSLSYAVMRALARDPARRYQSAGEFADALSNCIERVERLY